MLKMRTIDGEPVSVVIDQHEFEIEEETGYVTVPKEFLTGFHLADIPAEISIKPVEEIEDRTIHIKNDVAVSGFIDGSAAAVVEEMFRRKFWDGATGLSPYVAALRRAIGEAEGSSETDFEDDGDYVFVHYEIMIAEDLWIQDAISFVDAAIERIEMRAEQLANRRTDGLTGLFERASFDCDLTHAMSGNRRAALLMADIDHFRRVNDTHGHPVGDAVLRAVANILLSKCDGQNVVAYRYGGEELAVIVRGEAAATAVDTAESIRTEVEQLRIINNAAQGLTVTVSVGVAAAPAAEGSAAELVKRADAALYRAKQEGRNRVIQSK